MIIIIIIIKINNNNNNDECGVKFGIISTFVIADAVGFE